MLKKNLFAIIIVTLGLVMAINTFGQGNNRPNKKKPEINRQDAQIKLMYVANQEEYMAGGIADVRGGVHNRGEETTSRKKQNNSAPKPNEQNKNCQEFEAVKSPRDVASGQSTGIKSNAAKQPAGLVTEISFPKEVKHKNSKWELGEYDASKHKSAKPKGYNLGDTATHERKRKGQN